MINSSNDIDLSSKNTFRIKAYAKRWIEYNSIDDLRALFKQKTFDSPWMHIGAGSNLLFTADFNGTLLHSAIDTISDKKEFGDRVILSVGSGVVVDNLIDYAIANNLWGLENLTMIPGEVGSAAVQNVGAYGVEFGQLVRNVNAYDTLTDEFITIPCERCEYAYRNSLFKTDKRYIIVGVEIELTKAPSPNRSYAALKTLPETASIQEIRDAINAMRSSKLPDVTTIGSAGSFFKNPVVTTEQFNEIINRSGITPSYFKVIENDREAIKISAASLIDNCGLKGASIGDAYVWEKQPLVIANRGHATAKDIIALEKKIQQCVNEKFGVELQPEVEHI